MAKFVAHIRVEQHPNTEMRTYHLNRLVSKQHIYSFGIDGLGNYGEKDPGEVAKKLSKALERIPGVSKGTFAAYEVSIGKSSAFDWQEVDPFVLGQIVKHVFPQFIGREIQISSTLSVIEGEGFVRRHNLANRQPVLVKFGAKKRPRIDVEKLFNPPTLHKVVDNDQPTTPEKVATGR